MGDYDRVPQGRVCGRVGAVEQVGQVIIILLVLVAAMAAQYRAKPFISARINMLEMVTLQRN